MAARPMKVHVQLLGYLAKYSPTGKEIFTQDLDPEATIGRLLEKIDFPPNLEKMVLVNGHRSNEATRLAEGDEVFIFSPAAGG
jgi:molybdopterin converting factor small subunit